MEANKVRRRRKGFDSQEYLKFALLNSRTNRMKKTENLSEESKIKATSQNGFTFFYSVSDSANTEQDYEEDASDEDDSDDEEDEIRDYVSTSLNKSESSQYTNTENGEFSTEYLDFFDSMNENQDGSASKSDSALATSVPTSFEEFVTNLENAEPGSNTETFISYEHFFSALNESSKFKQIIEGFDELSLTDSAENSEEKSSQICTSSGDSLISGKSQQAQNTANTDSAIDEVFAFMDDHTKMNSAKFVENYTLTYIDSAIDSDYMQLKSNDSPPSLNFSNITELENYNHTNSGQSKQLTENQSSDLEKIQENETLYNTIDSALLIGLSELENNNTNSAQSPHLMENQQSNVSVTNHETSYNDSPFQLFSNAELENNNTNSAQSQQLTENESSDSAINQEKSYNDSAYQVINGTELVPNPAFSFCFTPEEIEEFINEFDSLT